MERFSEHTYTFPKPRTIPRSTPTPPFRQPIPSELRHLSPLQVLGMGRQERYQILRRLPTLQAWSHLCARRVSPACETDRQMLNREAT